MAFEKVYLSAIGSFGLVYLLLESFINPLSFFDFMVSQLLNVSFAVVWKEALTSSDVMREHLYHVWS